MRILPVLDLQGGLVVRGIAGQREAYRPIESPLAPTPAPLPIARAYRHEFGLDELYVADLDAIARQPPCDDVYRALVTDGFRLWVDAGITDTDRAAQLAEFEVGGRRLEAIVAGLESVPDPQALAEIGRVVGRERLVFSLDLAGGTPLAGPAWGRRTPLEIVDAAAAAGIRRMIVLDLARVGVGSGVGTLALCRQIRAAHPRLRLIAGGGVRHLDDLQDLAAAGCETALVASALHDGRLTRDDVAAADKLGCESNEE